MLANLVGFVRSILRNRRRLVAQPRFLTYTVTYSCNARCIMCDSWKMPSPDDLSVDDAARIFAQLPAMDAVRLTGGEPFVRQDFDELAELAQRMLRPVLLHVTTNGFLTERIVRFCERRGKGIPLHLLVSVDGVGEKHNAVRGHRAAWSSVIETIEALARRQRDLRVKLAVNQTIVDAEGIEHYRLLRERLRPLGIRNNVVMAYDISATYSLDRHANLAPTQIGQFTTFGRFTDNEVWELLHEVERDLPRYPFWERLAKRYYLRGLANRLVYHHGSPNPRCVALHNHLRILPNGDVPTCQFNGTVAGNLRRQPFAQVWHSATAAQMRRWVRQCPGCWAECEVVPSAIYTGDLLLQGLLPARPTRPPAPPTGTASVTERGARLLPAAAAAT